MDKQFYHDAADTCGLAIDLIIKLWPETGADLDAEIKETLRALNALKEDFLDAESRLV